MRKLGYVLLVLTAIGVAGCTKTQQDASTAAPTPDATAAADGNLAPVSGSAPSAPLAPSAPSAPQQQTYAPQQTYQNQAPPPPAYDSSAGYQDVDDGSQPVYASAPPPPLPEYSQPPCPG